MSVEVRWGRGHDAGSVLRELAVEVTGADPGPLHHLCPACGSITHGQPHFDAAFSVSLARAGELVVVALSLDGAIGVDVTEAPEEAQEGAQEWTRTEAVSKARGTGLAVEHDQSLPDLWISDLKLPGPFVGAVAGVRDELSPPPAVRAAPRRTATC